MDTSIVATRTRHWQQSMSDVATLCQAITQSDTLLAQWDLAFHHMHQALHQGRTIFFAGNGGSAADAAHLAAELVCRFRIDRPAIPAIALGTNVANITAISNDLGYIYSLSRELEALAKPGDILYAMSTSGRSPNILNALEIAQQKKLLRIGFTGHLGDAMAPWCDVLIKIPSQDTARIQEMHKVIGHALCDKLEQSCLALSQQLSEASVL